VEPSERRVVGRHRCGPATETALRATAGVAVSALILAAAMWGFATSGTKYALAGFEPLTLLAVQLVAATVALWAALVVRDRWARVRSGLRAGWRPTRWTWSQWRLPLALGLLEPALAYLGDTMGLARTTAANASVIIGLESAFVVLLAALFLRERITRNLCLAVLAGLLGLVALEQVSWLTGPGLGDLLVLGGALSAAGYTIVARRVDESCDSLALTARQFAVASMLVCPAAIGAWVAGAEPVPTHAAANLWLAAVLVGVAGFALSFLIYNWAIVVVEAGMAAVIINLIPAFGLLSAVVWLGEELTAARLVGAGLITVSVGIFTWAEVRAGGSAAIDEFADAAAGTSGRDELAVAPAAAA
jgi:O-acetylserine/cysteine efflux transporter